MVINHQDLRAGVAKKGPATQRDALLRSGLLLEHHVGAHLTKAAFQDKGTYEYQRSGPGGSIESVDRWGVQTWVEEGVPFRLFASVECKYHTNARRWFFLPPPPNVADRSRAAFFAATQAPEVRRKLAPLLAERFNGTAPVGPGVSLFQNQSGGWENDDRHELDTALRQCTLPIGHHLQFMLEEGITLDYPPPVAIYQPMIVTNAELIQLSPDTTLEMVENLAQDEDPVRLGKSVQFVEAFFDPPTYAEQQFHEWIGGMFDYLFSTHTRRFVDGRLAEWDDDAAKIPHAMERSLLTNQPSRALICRAGAFGNLVETVARFYRTKTAEALAPMPRPRRVAATRSQ